MMITQLSDPLTLGVLFVVNLVISSNQRIREVSLGFPCAMTNKSMAEGNKIKRKLVPAITVALCDTDEYLHVLGNKFINSRHISRATVGGSVVF